MKFFPINNPYKVHLVVLPLNTLLHAIKVYLKHNQIVPMDKYQFIYRSYPSQYALIYDYFNLWILTYFFFYLLISNLCRSNMKQKEPTPKRRMHFVSLTASLGEFAISLVSHQFNGSKNLESLDAITFSYFLACSMFIYLVFYKMQTMLESNHNTKNNISMR